MKKVLLLLLTVSGFSCTKKSADVAPVVVPERLEINPATKSKFVRDTAQFAVTYYNNLGKVATPPQGIVWSTTNVNIATINQDGLATGLAVGQINIKASYKNAEASALFTVVDNENTVATVNIEPSTQEIILNDTATLSAIVRNNAGVVISGIPITWQSADNNLVAITSTGKVSGINYGTANVTATVNGITSAPAMVQVIRKGSFSRGSVGNATLKIENGLLKLQTSANFSTSSGAPDLRIYLGNNANNVNGAVEIATLNQRSGAQSWNLPSNINITQYRYVLVWCKKYPTLYGSSDLGTM